MQFSEVIGQQEAIGRLLQLVEEERIPHALLFTGPAGSGKLALALAFASYLLGERHEGHSLQDNDRAVLNAETMLAKWQHPDLHFSYPVIRPKGTSSEHKVTSDDFAAEWRILISKSPYFTMDQWMNAMEAENQQAVIYEAESDALTHTLNMKSALGGYKVSLIWLPERMNITCANKLLKLLEEPPLQTVFLLVSEEPEQLLETIRSRVQRFDVHRIDTSDIEQALISKRGIDNDTAHRLAHTAAGNWLKAIEVLDSDSENRLFFDLFVSLMRQAYMRDVKGLKAWTETTAAYGREKQRRMLAYFLHLVRENFISNFKQPELNYMTQEEETFSRQFARFINERNIVEMAEQLQRTYRDIGQNANPKMQFFNLALNIIILLRR